MLKAKSDGQPNNDVAVSIKVPRNNLNRNKNVTIMLCQRVINNTKYQQVQIEKKTNKNINKLLVCDEILFPTMNYHTILYTYVAIIIINDLTFRFVNNTISSSSSHNYIQYLNHYNNY